MIITLIISTEYLWECQNNFEYIYIATVNPNAVSICCYGAEATGFILVYPPTAQSQNDRGCMEIRAVDLQLQGNHNLVEEN